MYCTQIQLECAIFEVEKMAHQYSYLYINGTQSYLPPPHIQTDKQLVRNATKCFYFIKKKGLPMIDWMFKKKKQNHILKLPLLQH